MFDVNPLATKYYLKDLERQVAASHQPVGISQMAAGSSGQKMGTEGLIAVYGRLFARTFTLAVRNIAAAKL